MAQNAAFFWENQLVGAELAASGEAGDGKIGNIVQTQLKRAWRALGSTASFTAAFGAARPVRFLALAGVTLGAAATLRLRLSSSAAHAGDLHDPGAVAADARATLDGRRQCLLILPAEISAPFAKVDLSDPGAGFIDVGYACLGPWWQPQKNFGFGFGNGTDSASVQEIALGGALYATKRTKARVRRFTLGFLTPAEEAAQGAQITDRAGNTGLFGMIQDPASADAARDMILGHLRDLAETTGVTTKIRARPFELRELV